MSELLWGVLADIECAYYPAATALVWAAEHDGERAVDAFWYHVEHKLHLCFLIYLGEVEILVADGRA